MATNNAEQAHAAPRLLSIDGACSELGVRRTTLYGLIRSGRLRSITIGRRRLVPADEIDRFIAERIGDIVS